MPLQLQLQLQLPLGAVREDAPQTLRMQRNVTTCNGAAQLREGASFALWRDARHRAAATRLFAIISFLLVQMLQFN